MSWLDAALTAWTALLMLPVAVLCIQILLAVPLKTRYGAPARNSRVAVLMPAHNESAGITSAIHSVLPQLQAGDWLLVVADNCTDDTAAIAATEGARVVQRSDSLRRGKGYALDFGVRHLEQDPPEVVVIVDADCALGPDCLAHLASRCLRMQRPVQALYLMHSPPGAGLKARLAELAWVVKNQARPLGYGRLGLPCQLMGTGMAFPWALIRNAPLATGHLVEDLQLGLDMASAGSPPLFCPQALVNSSFPTDAAGLATQRTRWEHGHLGVIASQAPRLLWRSVARGQLQLMAMVLDLCVPPLASLALLLILSLLAALALLALDGFAVPLVLAGLALCLFFFSVLLAWHRFGRRIVSLGELFSVPGYVLAKLPIYARLLKGRQAEWIRTKRGDGPR